MLIEHCGSKEEVATALRARRNSLAALLCCEDNPLECAAVLEALLSAEDDATLLAAAMNLRDWAREFGASQLPADDNDLAFVVEWAGEAGSRFEIHWKR